jgi:polysaccharide chain length determinant protein (PEP-CTERM system associated)
MAQTSEFEYKKYLQLVARKKYLFVIMALVIMTAVVAASYLLPAKYEARSTVFIEKSVIADLVKGIAVTPSLEDKIRVLAYSMKSRTLLQKVFSDLDLDVSKSGDAQRERMIKEFQDKTDIKLNEREGLFIISYYDENPRLARDFVNALVRRYIEENSSSKREESYGASKFLSEQIIPVKDKLEKIDARISDFRREHSNVLAEGEPNVLSDISLAQQKLDEITIRRNQLVAVLDMNRGNNPLQAKLAELQKRLRELSTVYTDNYPEVISVKNEIDSVKEQMKTHRAGSDLSMEAEKAKLELKTLGEIEQNLQRSIAAKRAVLRRIPEVRTSLEELEREKEAQKNLYSQLLARYGQSEVSKQMEVHDKTSTFRIGDPAVMPAKPFSPNRVKMILLGIFGGLVGSLAVLVLLDYLDSSVRDLDTLKSLGVPVLAVVPKIQNPADLKLARIRDTRFFAVTGAYFLLILAILSIEVMQQFSINLVSVANMELNLSQLKTRILK